MIRLISSCNVKPKSCVGRDDQLELTPCDIIHLVFPMIRKCLIFHKHESPIDGVIDRLKATLSEALDIFYPLAGRLDAAENEDGTATYSVRCCRGDGALFVHAAADDVTVDKLLDCVDVPRELLRQYFPMNGVLSYQGVTEPLLAVQVTEAADGIILACTASHVVIDGTSLWQFLNAWSHISRGGDSSPAPKLPVFERSGLFDEIFELPLRVPFSYNNLPGQIMWWKQNQLPIASRIFRFSKAKILELKTRANSVAGLEGKTISSFQALMAHLWVSVTRSRRLAAGEEVSYWVVVGLRPRTLPKLPDEYFGNAVRTVRAISTAGELLSSDGIAIAARHINRAISSQTPAEVKGYLAELAKNPALVGSEELPRNMLLTGGSPRFNVFGNDFGWGRPFAVRNGGGGMEGLLTPMPGTEEGSIDFEFSLFSDTLLALAEDPHFAGETLVR